MPDTEKNELSQDEVNSTDTAIAEEEKAPPLTLEVKVDTRSTCERHITVTVAREDIDRYFDKEFSELMPKAHVPGFRPGHAPRKLVESRFRKDIAEKVKGDLLMNCLTQVNEQEKLSAISEPDFDFEAVELPEEGPLTFEFDVEVRPEFEMPQWRGLKIEKPVREFNATDVNDALQNVLARRGRLVPFDGPATAGDYVTANLTFKHGDEVLSSAEEEVIRIRPTLSFRDGNIPQFDKLMAGVRGGETRQGEAELSNDAPNVALRGQKVSGNLQGAGSQEAGNARIDARVARRVGRFQRRRRSERRDPRAACPAVGLRAAPPAREQITAALTVAANWDLPPGLLQRQARRELQRAVMELQRSGFSDEEIQSHENALRQNSMVSTAKALKEHFILERIAEDEEIDAGEEDYEAEIRLIASQSDESPRRVRARLEKSGSMDVLRNQIIERKVIERILSHATFKEVPYHLQRTDESAVDRAAGGGEEADIPEAKYDEGEEVPEAKKEGLGERGEGRGERGE